MYYADVADYNSIKNELKRIISDSKKGNWNDYVIRFPEEYTKSYVVNEYLSIE